MWISLETTRLSKYNSRGCSSTALIPYSSIAYRVTGGGERGGPPLIVSLPCFAMVVNTFFRKKSSFFARFFSTSREDFKCKRQVHAQKKVKKIYERCGRISAFRLIFGHGKRNQMVGSGGHRSWRWHFNGGLRHKRIQQGAESGTHGRWVRGGHCEVLSRDVRIGVQQEILTTTTVVVILQ